MSEIKVAEMIKATQINDNDLLMIVQNEKSKKAKVSTIKKQEYSTEDVNTGNTWNGKPIYRKTIVMSNVTETNKTYDLSSLSIETCMIDSSHSYFEQGNYQIPIGCYGGATDYSRAFFEKNTKSLYMQFGTTYTMSKEIHITIEYTKTTDEVMEEYQ